ncbi:MAG: phage tail family protein [Coriobacteriia bacterium]|nr:phage tail family protein [Coriobacteriia bacterium]MCL2870768.1 phage tail family protein [Coriobacteriia bacterium]
MLFDRKLYGKIFDVLEDDTFDQPDLPEVPDIPEPEVQPPLAPVDPNQNLLDIEISNSDRVLNLSSHAHELNVLIGHDGLMSTLGETAHFDHAILDGGTVGGTRAQSRRITLDFAATGVGHAQAASLFPLGRKETIKVTRGNTTRVIEGYRDGIVELHAASALATPVISVSFLCPEPFFKSAQGITSDLDGTTGGLEYPVEPSGYPAHYGTIGGSGSTTVFNYGDYPASFVLSMTATAAGTINLLIDGEEHARITGVASGERIVFDTVAKMLSVGGQKRLNALEGTFPKLPLGKSEVELVGLAGNPRITFHELFEGV